MIKGVAGEAQWVYLRRAPQGLLGTLKLAIVTPENDTDVVADSTAAVLAEIPTSDTESSYVGQLVLPIDGDYQVRWTDTVPTPDKLVFEELHVGATDDSLDARLLGVVTAAGPVAVTGDVVIVRGDDYYNADSRALEWQTDEAGTWPDLTGATIAFAARVGIDGAVAITKAGTVVTPTGVNKKVRVELSATDTAQAAGNYTYDVQATLSGGHKVTLVRDRLALLQDVAT